MSGRINDVPALSPGPAEARRQVGAVGGIIILLVLCASYTLGYQGSIGHTVDLSGFPPVGFLALQLFLASTGFRLAEELQGSGGYAYLRGRVLRFGPLVIPSVLLGYVLLHYAGLPGEHPGPASLPANLLMVEDLIGAPRIDEAHWRLKIELMLSVGLGLAWFGLGRKHLRTVLATGLVASACLLTGEPGRENTLTLTGLMTLDGYLPFAAFGVALLYVVRDRANRPWLILGGVAAALAFLSNTAVHGLVILAAFALLALAGAGRVGFLGRQRWLVRLGELAFPIYVTHRVLGFVVIYHLEQAGVHPVAAIGVASVLAVLTGWVACRLIERPAVVVMGHFERWALLLRSRVSKRAATAGEALGRVSCTGDEAKADALA